MKPSPPHLPAEARRRLHPFPLPREGAHNAALQPPRPPGGAQPSPCSARGTWQRREGGGAEPCCEIILFNYFIGSLKKKKNTNYKVSDFHFFFLNYLFLNLSGANCSCTCALHGLTGCAGHRRRRRREVGAGSAAGTAQLPPPRLRLQPSWTGLVSRFGWSPGGCAWRGRAAGLPRRDSASRGQGRIAAARRQVWQISSLS